ncbi:MAG: nucleoside triphosphate pyrophosphatase [Pseudomonadota bacterium]
MARADNRIYLASQSPRRRELLKQIGVRFDVLVLRSAFGREDVQETPLANEEPRVFARRMAEEKANKGVAAIGLRQLIACPVLGADTVVDIDGEIIGKPCNLAHAGEILQRLSGRAHWVHTGVAVGAAGAMQSRLSSSKVEFAPLSRTIIERYLESGEALDKAGAYGIQGRAGTFITRIEGSYTGIMGLPLFETAELLNWAGIRI